ncbi:MAG TPA: DNA primase [Bacteroidia bacterium]|nr:DNA primase [Bacteroidia bacterium]
MIPRETIDSIFAAARVEEVVGDFVNLKKRGANYMGLCPFHHEKTPSFTVSPAKGIYKCFGCGKGGNVVNFVMDHEQLDYVNALKYLAKKYNIEIVEAERTPEQQEQETERESLMVISAYAQRYFTEQLHTEHGKAIGLSYFEERGFTPETIEKFQLGYAPEDSKAFLNTALQAGYNLKYMLMAGLVRTSVEEAPGVEITADKCYDRFAGRMMFPIHNISGRVIAFGGRTLRKDKNVAKYVNSPETPLYHKSNILYGLSLARKAISAEDNCFLVEGYADVISMHQAGVENVVASSGTSLTIEQIRLIRRYTPNLTILYDGDAAGVKAAERGFNIALKEGMNVKIVTLPPEDDPDTFARKHNLEELKQYITSKAVDFIVFKTTALAHESTNDPIKKAELIRDIVSTISVIPDRVTRSVYVKECSRLMEIEESVLLDELRGVRRKMLDDSTTNAATQKPAIQLTKKPEAFDLLSSVPQEREIIRVLIKYGTEEGIFMNEPEKGEEPAKFTMKIADYIIESMKEDNFTFESELCHRVFEECCTLHEEGRAITEEYFLRHSDAEISQMAMNLSADAHPLSDWSRRSIGIKTEKDHLGISAEKAVYAFKSRKIEIMIKELDDYIKNPINEQELNERMERKQRLNNAKRMFKNKLGRVI